MAISIRRRYLISDLHDQLIWSRSLRIEFLIDLLFLKSSVPCVFRQIDLFCLVFRFCLHFVSAVSSFSTRKLHSAVNSMAYLFNIDRFVSFFSAKQILAIG